MHTLTQIPGTVQIPPLTQPLVSAKTETAAPAELEITMVITAQMHSQIMEIIRIMTQKIGGVVVMIMVASFPPKCAAVVEVERKSSQVTSLE